VSNPVWSCLIQVSDHVWSCLIIFDQLSAEILASLIKGFPTTRTTTTTTKQNVDPAVYYVYSRVKSKQRSIENKAENQNKYFSAEQFWKSYLVSKKSAKIVHCWLPNIFRLNWRKKCGKFKSVLFWRPLKYWHRYHPLVARSDMIWNSPLYSQYKFCSDLAGRLDKNGQYC
jgi:hypothetical protein